MAEGESAKIRYLAEAEAAQTEMTGKADASKVRYLGEAEASRIRNVGESEAYSQKAVGEAKADAYRAQVEAMGGDNIAMLKVVEAIAEGKTEDHPRHPGFRQRNKREPGRHPDPVPDPEGGQGRQATGRKRSSPPSRRAPRRPRKISSDQTFSFIFFSWP